MKTSDFGLLMLKLQHTNQSFSYSSHCQMSSILHWHACSCIFHHLMAEKPNCHKGETKVTYSHFIIPFIYTVAGKVQTLQVLLDNVAHVNKNHSEFCQNSASITAADKQPHQKVKLVAHLELLIVSLKLHHQMENNI